MSTAVSGRAHSENPHAGQGSVLLDIGGDIGALVVTMPASTVGAEVDIRPQGRAEPDGGHDHGHGHAHWPHVAVVERPVPGGGPPVPSLVYGDLEGGSYELLLKGTTEVVLTVLVEGGRVTTATWPG